MAGSISPQHTQEQFKGKMSLDDKIEVFVSSVKGWQIGTAKEMIEKGPVNWDFGILKVIMSYFEMIAKYRDGYAAEGKSQQYFKEGFRQVFPVIDTWENPAKTMLLDWVYEKVRCGLYHAGMTLANIGISRDIPNAVERVTTETRWEDGRIEHVHQVNINVVGLVTAIQNDFDNYASELRDQDKAALREKFQTRFDFDRRLSPAVEVGSKP